MYSPVDIHKKKSSILVVHCADPRFQDAYRQAIDGLGQYFDLLVVPGPSKAIVENPSVLDDIKLLHKLHHFESIHIMDHVQCAAFGPVNDEVESHAGMMESAERILKGAIAGINVIPHLLGKDKEIKIA